MKRTPEEIKKQTEEWMRNGESPIWITQDLRI